MDTKSTILNFAASHQTFRTSDVVKHLDKRISRQHVSSVLNDLFKRGQLVRQGSGAFVHYTLPQNINSFQNSSKKRLINQNLKEHEVMQALKSENPFLKELPENIDSIFNYSFSEMLNNAIEHSNSKLIDIEVQKNEGSLTFFIRDFGIGVFNSIMKKNNLISELDAIQEILKGKATTQPKSHSGEGIFFTSKAGDNFILESSNRKLKIDNLIKDIFVEEIKSIKGTRVTFQIDLNSKRHLQEIFEKYSNPVTYEFDKTEIHIKLYTLGSIYVSRSQGRRVTENLDKFKSVILDFDQVPTIGQAFADEIFRVFALKHPNIQITPINTNEAVNFMIKRAKL